MLTWSSTLDPIDWSEVETLYRLAPLGNKSAAHLQTVFTNSRYRWFVRDNGQLVAAGRALADGADWSYICDVAALPSHQGTGLGKVVVSRLLDSLPARLHHRRVCAVDKQRSQGGPQPSRLHALSWQYRSWSSGCAPLKLSTGRPRRHDVGNAT